MTHLRDLSFSFSNDVFIKLFEKQSIKREGTETNGRDSPSSGAHPQVVVNSQRWTRLKLGARNSSSVSHVGRVTQ